MANVNIEESWKEVLTEEFNKPYFEEIVTFIKDEKLKGKIIYPPGNKIFEAFRLTPFNQVKVVILGQDPYHNPNEAMGLSFSVPQGIRVPPSLQNIFKELSNDLQLPIPKHGNLTKWAEQGVLLLNACLTVEHGIAASHQAIGWQTFTDVVIQKLSKERNSLVFMLWGNYAKRKRDLIDPMKHLILEAAHPSPLARGAFNGNKHFSQANTFLVLNDLSPIDFNLI
jgi:uracil-DNA glycosylase